MQKDRIILASGSASRKSLLSALQIPFEVIPAEIDEKSIRDIDLKQRAEKIARAKAEKIISEHEGIVIAGDTFVALGETVLEKPIDLDDAKRMLRMQSGKHVRVLTGFCYIHKKQEIDFSTGIVIDVTIRELSDMEIETYVRSSPVLTWSAAFSSAYSSGAALIAEMEGSFTGFVYGLPAELLVPLLRKSGY